MKKFEGLIAILFFNEKARTSNLNACFSNEKG